MMTMMQRMGGQMGGHMSHGESAMADCSNHTMPDHEHGGRTR